MNLKIRQEKEMDYTISENLVEKAFKNAGYEEKYSMFEFVRVD